MLLLFTIYCLDTGRVVRVASASLWHFEYSAFITFIVVVCFQANKLTAKRKAHDDEAKAGKKKKKKATQWEFTFESPRTGFIFASNNDYFYLEVQLLDFSICHQLIILWECERTVVYHHVWFKSDEPLLSDRIVWLCLYSRAIYIHRLGFFLWNFGLCIIDNIVV